MWFTHSNDATETYQNTDSDNGSGGGGNGVGERHGRYQIHLEYKKMWFV